MSQLFGIVAAGLPVITAPYDTPTPASALYAIDPPAGVSFDHVVVFLLPGVQLPQGTAAAIYLVGGGNNSEQLFLGGVGPGKESAIFQVRGKLATGGGAAGQRTTIGIAIEEAGSVAQRIGEKKMQLQSSASSKAPSTLLLAQRIIQNAFNFLASYSSGGSGNNEVVPLRAFEEWWRKFEGRVRSDPTFLERAVE